MPTTYLTTTIPYVNAAPHLGHALEAVQADALARHRRQTRRRRTAAHRHRRQLAQERPGRRGGRRTRCRRSSTPTPPRSPRSREPLALSYDDFIRTSVDPRHRVGVERLWRACADAGDLYQARYEGLYCVGCEHYLTEDDLDPAGHCPEHRDAAATPRRAELVLPALPLPDRLLERDPPAAPCGSSPSRGATRCSRSSRAGCATSPSRGPATAPAAGASPCPATRARSSTSGGTRSATT